MEHIFQMLILKNKKKPINQHNNNKTTFDITIKPLKNKIIIIFLNKYEL